MTNETSKPSRTALYIQVAILLASAITGVALYSYLPDMLPMHWGLDGQPNNWWPKQYGVFLMPGMMLAFIILFPLLSRLDPKARNYSDFARAWSVMQTAILAIFGYFYGVTMFVSVRPEYNQSVGRLISFGVGVLFVILGNYMGKVRQNYFIGLRTPWTLDDPEVWQKSQRFAGWAFVISGLIIIAECFLWIAAPYVFFTVILLMIGSSFIYSYLASRKK